MNTLYFNRNVMPYANKYAEWLDYDYHVNAFDFPMRHKHADYWEFTLLTNGKLYNVLNGVKETYEANTVFFATTDDEHYMKKASDEPLRYINVAVRKTIVMNVLNSINKNFAEELKTGKHSYVISEDSVYKIENIIYKVNLLSSNQCEVKNKLLCSALLVILQEILFQKINPYEDTLPSDDLWIHKMTLMMQRKDFTSCTVNDLCEMLGYSRMQLNRLFKRHFDMTPHEYLTNYKLHYARNLLRSTDMKIIDIAMNSGYSTISQFQVNFKAKYGVSPSEFRKNGKL